jgi:hypothetical protein
MNLRETIERCNSVSASPMRAPVRAAVAAATA